MAGQRIYLDTFFVQALLNANDLYHERAMALFPEIRSAAEVVTTEAVLTEIGNALSAGMRQQAAKFIARPSLPI